MTSLEQAIIETTVAYGTPILNRLTVKALSGSNLSTNEEN